MRFIYKINSAYDGFTPAKIPERLRSGSRMKLGWKRYVEVVERGHEVWVYFRGPHAFASGVYIKGVVRKIDARREQVSLRVKEYDAEAPLTDEETSRRVAKIARPNRRPAFLLRSPDRRGWFSTPVPCSDHRGGRCPPLQAMPPQARRRHSPPHRLPH